METSQLCKCTNCSTIMIDANPDEQPEFEVKSEYKEMEWFTDDGGFWGCPVCYTDEYLIDIIEENQLI